ncbi:MAG: LytTR family DNA-binding domain-containing protein [Bacilli bacterium]
MVKFVCSEKLQQKLRSELEKYGIMPGEEHDIVLVEKGYPLPEQGTCILFDPLDYPDMIRLLVSGVRTEKQTDTVSGWRNNKYTILKPQDLFFIEVYDETVSAHTASEQYTIKETLGFYETLWTARGWFRANKSQLVNLLHVKEIIPWFNSRFVLRLTNGKEIEVSKMYAKKLRSQLKL